MIGIVDYGAGNLQSVGNALDRMGARYRTCRSPEQLDAAERILLPGVGHFGAAARALAEAGMMESLRRQAASGKPLLGICLGMQLLLEGSDEAPGASGLGLLSGRSVRLRAPRVPHMGWNRVTWKLRSGVLDGTRGPAHFYFAHAYAVEVDAPGELLATTEYAGAAVAAAVGRDRILGVQFHPEKSAEAGLGLLDEFCRC